MTVKNETFQEVIIKVATDAIERLKASPGETKKHCCRDIVTETNVSSSAVRETYVTETNFAARKQENVFASVQKHFCFPGTNFASKTYVSQFSHHESNVD